MGKLKASGMGTVCIFLVIYKLYLHVNNVSNLLKTSLCLSMKRIEDFFPF